MEGIISKSFYETDFTVRPNQDKESHSSYKKLYTNLLDKFRDTKFSIKSMYTKFTNTI